MKYKLWIQREESMSSVLFNEFDTMIETIKTVNEIADLFERHGLDVKTDYQVYESIKCIDVYVIIKE